MIQKQPLISQRIRKINGSFAWIGHEFLRRGFWNTLTHHELLLYLFLVIIGDRNGLSFYSFDKLCSLLSIDTDEYIEARNALIDKDLIAFDGYLFQVLSLPETLTLRPDQLLLSQEKMARHDPATIHQIVARQFGTLPGSHE
jgi:hypothetical protein